MLTTPQATTSTTDEGSLFGEPFDVASVLAWESLELSVLHCQEPSVEFREESSDEVFELSWDESFDEVSNKD
jgi:hypothetical protein